MEQDEAGRLRAFRERFGRGWDLDSQEGEGEDGTAVDGGREEEESLMDLISGAGGVDVGSGGRGKGATDAQGEDVKMIKVMKDGKLMSVPAQSRSERRK